MDKIKVIGKQTLSGKIYISGSKNSVVSLLPAAILSDEVVIEKVPHISDVVNLEEILRFLNVKFSLESGTIHIDSTEMINRPITEEYSSKLRASYYFMGALLGKFGHVQIKMPGGCYLGPRPIDLHLKGFEALGATVDYENGCYILHADELVGTNIFLDISSVGATINIMMAAVYANGRTTIENAAREPEIIDIATLLNKMGAKIHGMGTSTIVIDGVSNLGGCLHEIIPDRIEAGTFLIIAAACSKRMVIDNVSPQHLDALISKLEEIILVFILAVVIKFAAAHADPDPLSAVALAQIAETLAQGAVFLPPSHNGRCGNVFNVINSCCAAVLFYISNITTVTV